MTRMDMRVILKTLIWGRYYDAGESMEMMAQQRIT